MADHDLFRRADWWDPGSLEAALHELLGPVRLPFLREVLQRRFGDRPLKVLDVGAGGGLVSVPLARDGHRVVGVDIVTEGFEGARNAGAGLDAAFVAADAHQLPFGDDVFDVVVASEVLEHVEAPARVVGEAARVLTADGIAVFTGPNRTRWSWFVLILLAQRFPVTRVLPADLHDHEWFVTPEELQVQCAQAGLEIVEVGGVGWPIWQLPKALWTVRKLRSQRRRGPVAAGLVPMRERRSVRLAYVAWAARPER